MSALPFAQQTPCFQTAEGCGDPSYLLVSLFGGVPLGVALIVIASL